MSAKGFTNGTGGIGGFAENIGENILGQVSGIVSVKPTAKYASGARTIIKINNKLAGFAFSVSWKITTDQTEIRTIDDYMPYEYVPNRITVEGTIGAFHIPGQGASAALIQSDALSFLFQKYITIEVRDSATDEVLFFTNTAVITSRAEDLTAEQLGKVQLTWKAIGWLDERKPQVPDDVDNTGSSAGQDTAGSRLLQKGGQILTGIKNLF